jgi:hypothetical protein
MASMNVSVRLSDGTKLDVSVPDDSTVLSVKQAIAPKLSPPGSADGSGLTIVFKGRILADGDVLKSQGGCRAGRPASLRPRRPAFALPRACVDVAPPCERGNLAQRAASRLGRPAASRPTVLPSFPGPPVPAAPAQLPRARPPRPLTPPRVTSPLSLSRISPPLPRNPAHPNAGFEDGMAIHVVRKKAAAAPAAAPSSSPSTGAAASASSPSATSSAGAMPRAAGGGVAGGPVPSLMAGFGGARAAGAGAGTGGLFGALGGGGGGGAGDPFSQIFGNPEAMRAITESPLFQSIMSNPRTVESMLMANPETRALLNSNPELRSALTDPAMIRQAMEAARNPDYHAEMARSTDRALANIESLPGGFNALRRMYETVGRPLEEGLRGGGLSGGEGGGGAAGAASGAGTGPGAAPAPAPGITSDAMPNPWAAPSAGACC